MEAFGDAPTEETEKRTISPVPSKGGGLVKDKMLAYGDVEAQQKCSL